ncbi:MAG: NifU family protein, partial [Acidimicrobiales bacterium]
AHEVADRPPADLSGPEAQRIIGVLAEDVNPRIAMHGGWADLVAFENGTAYVRMSGGCQGCGLAKVTLSQGIAVAIQEAVPEVREVVDVTDHASGSNPYYEPSKK